MIIDDKSTCAKDFFDQAEETVVILAGRWADECNYENVADYAEALLPIAARCGVVIKRMTSRPFGCVFSCDGRDYSLTINYSGKYSYRRLLKS